MSQSGVLLTMALLLFGCAIGKSAQFPVQGWLPDMVAASPSSLSALTECLAGPFLIARVLPIFRQGLALNCGELIPFFLMVAWIGAISALLGALIATTQRNIWYILAYSISSVIGYMMVALGIAGLRSDVSLGYLAGTFLITIDAFISGLLLLTAAFVSYVIGTDDIVLMGGIKSKIAHRGMEVGVFTMIGLPPLSGFWCTNWIQTAALELAGEASQTSQKILEFSGYGLFTLLIVTGAFTAFYGLRMMGFIFGKGSHESERRKTKKIPALMSISFVAMLIITFSIDLSTPLLIPFFNVFFVSLLDKVFLKGVLDVFTYIIPSISTVLSILALAIGSYPAYHLYVARKGDPTSFTEKYRWLKRAHIFFWNRCYLDAMYYQIAYGMDRLSKTAFKHVEIEGVSRLGIKGVNEIFRDLTHRGVLLSRLVYPRLQIRGFNAFNTKFAKHIVNLSNKIRKTQTGSLSYNMLLIVFGGAMLVILLLLFGG